MELSRINDTGLKIKTKNATVVVDPTVKSEADVVLLLDPQHAEPELVSGAKVVIDGPGEYEVLGVSITGERVGTTMMFRLDDEASSTRMLLTTSKVVATAKEEEGEEALVIKSLESLAADALASFVQSVCIVFGDVANLPTESESVKKLPKVNLKKIEDLKGSIIILAKE